MSAPKPRRMLAAVVAALLMVPLVAAPAAATHRTLLRGISNLVFGPLDLLMAPWSSGVTIYENMQNIDDSLGVRIAYPVPGYVFLVGLTAGAAGLRASTGFLEILPGLLLLPFDADLGQTFNPADDAAALVEFNNFEDFPIRFGLKYAQPAS